MNNQINDCKAAEPMLTDEEFRLFSNLVSEKSGMHFKENRRTFLAERVRKRMKAVNAPSANRYYRLIAEEAKTELLIFLDVLTVNETAFFRNMPQFDLLRTRVLPDVKKRKQASRDRTIKIWSAGCSTGEEPYSIAMETLEAGQGQDPWDIRITGSDLSARAVTAAERGVYSADRVRDTVPPPLLARYFTQENGSFAVTERLRGLVTFELCNLKEEIGHADIDVIFCRNVMIYFDEEGQKRLATSFFRCLNPGGWLLLGPAETLCGWNMDMDLVCVGEGTAYRKQEGGQQ